MCEKKVILDTIRSIIQQIGIKFSEEGSVPRHLLVALYSILGDQVNAALDIVDRKGVIRISQFGGGREIYKVQGSRGVKYSVLSSVHFCDCPAFQFRVVEEKDLMCKHILALAIAQACCTVKQYTVTRQEMRTYLKQI